MTAFIVISIKDSLHWIVDGIEKSCPQNPAVQTFVSTGKICKEERGHVYRFTIAKKERKEEGGVETFENLLNNQISQFRHLCGDENIKTNIFVLDNPMTDEDVETSRWIMQEIRNVYASHKQTDFLLTHVLFSYDMEHPEDANRHILQNVIKELFQGLSNQDVPTNILYIDNQKRNGAALTLDKETHDLMVPRMLCDFMMLISNADNAYNLFSVMGASTSSTHVFSLGYAECMYYPDDIRRYYNLALHKDLNEFMLEFQGDWKQYGAIKGTLVGEDAEILDYERNPFGLRGRLEHLRSKYALVSFAKDINEFPDSVDAEIESIVKHFGNGIKNIKAEALEIAKAKDKAATEKLKQEAVEKGFDLSEIQDVEDAAKKVEEDYPEYIDREMIYRKWRMEAPVDADPDTDEGLKKAASDYERLLTFIESPVFRTYIVEHATKAKEDSCEPIPAESQSQSDRKGCLGFLGRFLKKRGNVVPATDTKVSDAAIDGFQWDNDLKKIERIRQLKDARRRFYALSEKIEHLQEDGVAAKTALNGFKLTSHCSSYDNLVDVSKLSEFYHGEAACLREKVIAAWKADREKADKENRAILLQSVFEKIKQCVDDEMDRFRFIDWEKPFQFIKTSIGMASMYDKLRNRAIPFVNIYTTNAMAENATTLNIYTDNAQWKEELEKMPMENSQIVACYKSTHIESKICVFQILQMDQSMLDGLVDLYSQKDMSN